MTTPDRKTEEEGEALLKNRKRQREEKKRDNGSAWPHVDLRQPGYVGAAKRFPGPLSAVCQPQTSISLE